MQIDFKLTQDGQVKIMDFNVDCLKNLDEEIERVFETDRPTFRIDSDGDLAIFVNEESYFLTVGKVFKKKFFSKAIKALREGKKRLDYIIQKEEKNRIRTITI